MRKSIFNSLLVFALVAVSNHAYAEEITETQIGHFLCEVQLCKNDAVISDIRVNKYNLANLSELIASSGKQILNISFHQETPNKEYIRDYSDCNLIISSNTSMTLSGCKITGKIAIGKSSRTHQLSLGDGETMHQVEAGWMSNDLKN